ncbi:MAG: MotA/TolQ/ExbB proton channel family protein [Nitrospirae bacterium]|nr:MotA/TolQ/ExbB proton channel family protein [Nitrospirota bacterium]
MDIATLLGAAAGAGMILFGILLGSPLSTFYDLPSVFITLGGATGSTLINFTVGEVVGIMKVAVNTIRSQPASSAVLIPQFVDMAQKAKREGILALEAVVEQTNDKFLATGVQLAVDGYDLEAIADILESDIEHMHMRHQSGVDIFNKIGYYAPAFGMIGTLIGLVQMLKSLNDPSAIGPGMATALITTFYGAIVANLICLPVAGKLANRSDGEVMTKRLIVQGILSISSGDNPRVVEQKLLTFLPPKERKSSFAGK